MYPRHTPGINETAERLFRRFPLGCPLTIIAVGIVLSILIIDVQRTVRGGLQPLYASIGILVLLIGLAVLPFGIATSIKRRRSAIILRCPRCGAESRRGSKPFTVQRWNDVPYAYVTCSQCGKDFTVDRYARLE